MEDKGIYKVDVSLDEFDDPLKAAKFAVMKHLEVETSDIKVNGRVISVYYVDDLSSGFTVPKTKAQKGDYFVLVGGSLESGMYFIGWSHRIHFTHKDFEFLRYSDETNIYIDQQYLGDFQNLRSTLGLSRIEFEERFARLVPTTKKAKKKAEVILSGNARRVDADSLFD